MERWYTLLLDRFGLNLKHAIGVGLAKRLSLVYRYRQSRGSTSGSRECD